MTGKESAVAYCNIYLGPASKKFFSEIATARQELLTQVRQTDQVPKVKARGL
jgi:hypothetical protein